MVLFMMVLGIQKLIDKDIMASNRTGMCVYTVPFFY